MGATENAEAAFIARMTASTTHELRNVLAVVKESAGLIEDLTLAFQQRKTVNPEKLLQATRRIDVQVTRGADLLTSLSRLAHGLDHAVEQVALGSHARQVGFLCQRSARQGRHILTVDGDGDGPTVPANSLAVQMMMVTAIDCCLEQWPEASAIAMRVGDHAGRPFVAYRGNAPEQASLPAPAGASSWARLQALAAAVHATVEVDASEFRIVFAGAGGAG